MNTRDPADTTTTVLAVLGSFALGFTALMNAILGTLALLSGHLAGAIGDASQKNNFDANLTTDAHHLALVAKLVAVGFGVLALVEFIGGELLRRRLRNIFVPIACGMTIAGEAAFSIWSKHFTSLDAIMIACALFAFWTWYRLPRPRSIDSAHSRLGSFATTHTV